MLVQLLLIHPIRYDKLSYSLSVHITLTQPIPLFGILYLSDNWFYTYLISSLLIYYRYSVVYLSVMLTDLLSFDCANVHSLGHCL
jgi:hypothetical protein